MKECIGNHFILNGGLTPSAEFDNSLVYKGDSVYEVIRITGGVPVFFDDHFLRLENSVHLRNFRLLAGYEQLKKDIVALVNSDKRKEINAKVVFNYNEGIDNYLVYYIESAYPTPEQYRKGVKGILFYAERSNPQSKVINYKLRSDIHQELVNEGAYEAILVNDENLVTEGSKSNIFFLKKDMLVTAPDEAVLKGVTRKHILEICRRQGIKTEFRCVNADDIDTYEAVFMTGTSPMVLPFCCVNDEHFTAGFPLFEKLRNEYLRLVQQSINQFKNSILD
jgi:branched-chain amino acid aminotransferase